MRVAPCSPSPSRECFALAVVEFLENKELRRKEKKRKNKRLEDELVYNVEAAWASSRYVGLAIRRSRVRVPLWPLAGFVLGVS